MKSKLLALLLTLMMCCSMLLLASCGGGGTTPGGNGGVDADDTTYSSVYDLYVAYAEANGITPDSYEVWLETITGADGVLGVNGIALEIRINGKTNDWEISYDGGTLWTSLGFKAATANIVGVVDIKFSSIEEDGKIYLIVDYFMSNNTSSSMRIEIGNVGGGETPDQPGEGGGETPDQPGEGGGETPDQPGEGGGETPDQPGEGGGETPDQPGEGGGETPDQPGEGGGETPDQPGEGGGEAKTLPYRGVCIPPFKLQLTAPTV